MDNQTEFEKLLATCRNALERFVFYKVDNKSDGEDILQEIYLTAFKRLDTLLDKAKFKAWTISIARNKINDFYRTRAKMLELPLDENISFEPSYSRMGITLGENVGETLYALSDIEKQILYLYYLKNKPQSEIAKQLKIPLGTVKSRLHNAKQSFKEKYPYPPNKKGDVFMNKLPDIMPDIKIKKTDKQIFPVVWEEITGWFIIPRLGEKLSWGMYDYPERRLTEYYELKVTGKAMVHGIEGVEIVSAAHNPTEFNAISSNKKTKRTFVAQLTDTHSRILLESHYVGDIKHIYTFYDEKFLKNWGFGNDNCGNEVNIAPKGLISKDDGKITAKEKNVLDVVGRYEVTVCGKTYDTILVIDIENYDGGMMSETYLDKNGRTVLWRRFNRNDWAYNRYKQLWSDRLPKNEKVTINGETYVHWYDCITDYIL